MVDIETVDARLDRPPSCRIGLISLASDWVSSEEIRAVCGGPDRAILETRIANDDIVTEASLRTMEAGIAEAAGRLPGGLAYHAAAYLCTSASMLFGDARVEALVQEVLQGARVTNPMQATIAALGALGARRIGLVTPYVREVTAGIALRLETEGFEVVRAASFGEPSDARVARISSASMSDAAARVAVGADAVFLSCTALRTVGLVAGLEARLGCPVVSSNLAVSWHLLNLAGRPPAPGAWGRLATGPREVAASR